MPRTVRRTQKGPALEAYAEIASLMARLCFSHTGAPAIGNGTTAGRLRTTVSTVGRVAGTDFTKAATDDLWNLSAQTATPAATFRAIWLYLDAAGVASIAAGSNAPTAALALAALPAIEPTKSVFGVFVAGPATNFAAALAAQGTIHNQIPEGAAIGGGVTYRLPDPLALGAA